MAVTTRTLRQFGNIFQNQENLGPDRFANAGDHVAAFRANLDRGRLDQTGGTFATQSLSLGGADDVGAAATTTGLVALQAILNGDSILSAGEIAIVSYETDTSTPASPDGLRFVLLTSIASGTTIYITDRAWTGSAFTNAAGEGTYTYVAPSALPAGTVITLSHAQLATGGITLSNAGETLYMYQGAADLPTHFLFAADVADGNTTFTGNLTGTGLVNGVNAVAVAQDNAVYVGAPTGIAQTQILSISNTTSWYGLDLDDNPGTPNFTEVIDTVVQNPFFDGHDMVMISGFRGGGQSDGILRIGEENNAQTAVNVARMFRDNAAFTGVEDISFDLENGFFFFLDTNGNATNRIMRGNITDLVSGNSTPTFTQIFATDGFGEIITGIEVDRAANKIYWWDGNFVGDFEGGWQLLSINYDGTGLTQVALLDTENTQGSPTASPGGLGDWALDIPHGFAYAVNSRGQVDGFGNLSLEQNHIVRVNLATGVITVLALDAADPRSNTGPGGVYNNGRLNSNEGQIIALDVDQNTGIVYFITQPESATGNGGVWSYNPATDDLQELWNQPSPNANNTLQTFPTSNMVQIEVDEIGARLFITTNPDSDHENDATPGINEHDASIHVLAIGAALGTAPTRFVRVYEPTALGAPRGMEIDYDSNVAVTTSNATYTESTNLPNSPAGPVITPYTNATVTDPDQTMIYGATVAITNGFVSGDTLSFTNSGGITGAYSAATGALVFTGLATLAAYQTVLNSVRFTNAGDNPTDYGNSQSRTLSVTAFDGLTHSDLANVNITIVGINDAPVNTVPGAAVAINEDNGVVLTGMSVADPDADPANQDIQVTLHVNHGTITVVTSAPGGVQLSDVTGNGTGTVVITATQNQINATFAFATGVTYLNTLDFNGADLLTITTNDLGLNGNDPGLSGNGTSEQDQDTRAINITPVNDAPVVAGDGTEDSLTIFEDQPSATGQTVSSLFLGQFTDQKDNQVPNGGVSVANTFIGVAVVANASSGATGQWQYLNGAVWTDIGTVSLAAAKLFNDETQFRFNPAFNYNGAEPLLTVRLIDSSGGASITDGQLANLSAVGATGGASAYSAGSVTLGGTILPVNDAPTSTNLNGDAATWTENGAAVALDAGTAATIADIDSPNFDTGTLTVAIASPLAQDGLFIGTVGTVTTGVGTVSVGGVQIGTFTGGGYGGGPLVITFDADATPAAVQELVRAIQYNNNAGDNPTGGTRTVNWTLVDGDGTANLGTDTLNVTTTVNVVAVNDAPQGTDATFAFNEDGSRILAAADFGFSDPAEGNNFTGVVITTLPTNGVLLLNGVPVTVAGTFVTAAQIAGNQLVFQSDANENGSPYATFTFQVRDDGGVLNGGVDTDQSPNTLTFNVNPVNDAPTSTNLNGDAATYAEGSAFALLDVGANATIADIDSPNFDTGTLTVAITGGLVAAEDQLVVTATGTVTFTVNTVSVGGIQIATYTGGGAGGGNLVFTFDADATPAAVAALIHAIGYTNSDLTSPTGGIRTIGWTLVDGDGVALGGADTLNLSSTVEVINVNSAPQGADATIALNEDGSRILAAADFGFSDPAEGDNFAGVVITTLPTNGVLLLNGVPVTVAGTFVTAAQIAGNQLVFQSDANENGTPYATFTFQVRDDGGIANGGQDTDQSPNTLTFNVNPVNDAPTSTNLNGDAAVYIEGSAAVLLDVGSNATIADIDSANFDTGTLTVAISGGVVAQDGLFIEAAGGITTGAGTVSFMGTQIGTFTGGGFGGGSLVFTFDADATPGAVQALVRAISYNNNGGISPTAGLRTISWTLVDGDGVALGGADTLGVTTTIDVQAINDAPTGTDNAFTINEDATYTFAASSFGFGDINGDQFAGVVVTTIPVPGTLFYDADGAGGGAPVAVVAGQFISAAEIALGHLYYTPILDGNGVPFSSFTFQVRDNGGTLNGGQDTDQSPNTVTFNVTAVNDAPTNNVPGGQTINEDASLTLSTGNGNALSVVDVDATTLTVTLSVAHGTLTLASIAGLSFSGGSDGTGDASMTFSGTAAAINAALGSGLTYNPNANFNGSDAISVVTTDGGQTGIGPVGTDSDSIAISITAINDAPVVIGDGTESAATIDEDTPGAGQTIQALFAGQYSDAADNQIPNGGASSPGQFSGVAVTANGSSAATGQWQYFSGGVWTDIGTVSDSTAKLLGDPFVTLIRFNPASNYNGPAPTLTVHLIDNSLPFGIINGQVVDISGVGATGGTTAYSTGTVVLSQEVTAVNDAPTNNVPGAQTINEDASLTLSTGNGNAISVADVDATTLTVTLSVAHGTLTLASIAGLSFSGGSDGTGDASMTFSGTAAAINAALGSGLTYNPTADFNGSDAISVVTTDGGQTGTGPVGTDSDSIAIGITAINDAPVVIGDGTETAAFGLVEDSPGPGQTIQALFAGQYSDAADNQIPNGGASSPGQFSGIAVTANGSSAVTGQWQYFSGGVWTDIGTVSDSTAKLLGDPFVTLIRFNPALNFNGPAPTLIVHLIDNSLPFGIVNGQVVDISGVGATGGTTAYSTGTVVLSQQVLPVNDAPLNSVPGAQVINEDASFTLSTGNGNAISVADVDATTLTVTLTVAHGTLTLASIAGLSFGAGDGTADLTMTFSGTAAAINAALGSGLTYNPTANYNGPDSIAVLTADNGQTGMGPPLQDNDSVAITINSVNDAPSGADNTLTGSEDDPLVLTAADFGFTDPIDGNAFAAVRIMTFPGNGTLFLDSDGPGGAAPVNLALLGPGVFVGIADINAGHLYFQPDPDEYGAGYANFSFQVQDDGGILNGGVDTDPTSNTITINIEPDNLPPVVDLDGVAAGVNYTTTFVEDGAAVAIGSGVLVSDPDAGLGDQIESATITLTDRVAGDSLTLTGGLPVGIVAVTTNLAGSITIQLTGPGSGAQYQALIESILYATTSQDPTVGGTDLARTITVKVSDGTIDSAVATTTVNITAIDDLPIAQPDAFVITESGTIVAGNLFADNGSGADSDPDGPPLSISAVNGLAGNVNNTISLGSGATLTVNSNGTFNYNPNTAFLPTPTPGSGASNTPGHDGFTYTVAGGNTVTVNITLTGLDTDDTLFGTAGTDLLAGGNGNDSYRVENSGDLVFESVGGGYDGVYVAMSVASYALAAGSEVEILSAIDPASSGGMTLIGNEFANTIIGSAGSNTLIGGDGSDVLAGGLGNDFYRVENAGDVILEYAGGGIDAVYVALALGSYTLQTGYEIELLSAIDPNSTAALDLTGNEINNTIIGTAGVNTLIGGGGNDVLAGGLGNDIYRVEDAGDVVLEYAGGGFDAVYAVGNYTLQAGYEIELLSAINPGSTAAVNLTGNEQAQYIIGTAGANIITGGGGADALYGLGGNDTYYVGSPAAQVFEDAVGGNDAVYSSTSFTLGAGQEIEFLSAGNFSETTNHINLTGNEFANTIYGNDSSNILDGKGGNDSLIGLGGADIFQFTTALGANNVDLIFGFVKGVDKIALDDAIFHGIGTSIADHVIYNNATGQLFYDEDGSGMMAAVQFATLSPGLSLTVSDFQVI
ncbi:MAG: large repetitive protein [Sphingomonadales bacterium]|nr:large repetitive protein [Sphingomonadales bacterium]